MDDEMVEKMARAMAEHGAARQGTGPDAPLWTWDKLFDSSQEYWRGKARAAIQAMIDAGWKRPEKPRLLADVS